MLVGKALSFTNKLSFSFFLSLFFDQYSALNSRAMDFGGSVVGKASTIGIARASVLWSDKN